VNAEGLYITKGDGNAIADSTPIDPEAVVGVGRLLVPAIGLPIAWAAQRNWLASGLWMLLMSGTLWCSRWAFVRPIKLLGHRGAIHPWARRTQITGSRRFDALPKGAAVIAIAAVFAVPAITLLASIS
jgi:hypothetical protein